MNVEESITMRTSIKMVKFCRMEGKRKEMEGCLSACPLTSVYVTSAVWPRNQYWRQGFCCSFHCYRDVCLRRTWSFLQADSKTTTCCPFSCFLAAVRSSSYRYILSLRCPVCPVPYRYNLTLRGFGTSSIRCMRRTGAT